jgi:hypothetical protein
MPFKFTLLGLLLCSSLLLSAQDSTITVLVLPPYVEIIHTGTSPDTQEILERILNRKDKVKVIKFPLKKLMGTPYQMVYDKKYCAPIIEKIKCDIIVMTRIITKNELERGIWPWTYTTRIYNIKIGKQFDSIRGIDLDDKDFAKDIASKSDKLVDDIIRSFNSK